jgi:hypothetical protein
VWSLFRSLGPTNLLFLKTSSQWGFACRPHPVLAEILQKIKVQLHQVMPNTIVQIKKFIWAISFCGGRMTANVADVFTMHYELHYQQKKITKFWVHYFPP